MPEEYNPERTLGPAYGAVATLAGYAPDPEQQLLLDLAGALDKDGKSLAFEVVVIAPRQNLKSGFEKQYALGQLFARHESLVPFTAHEFPTAAEMLNDIEGLIEGSDVLRSRVEITARGKVASRGAVPEIRLTRKAGGGRLIFKTRTAGGGRGLSGNRVVLDESYALQAGQVGALYPIMLAKPDPQVIVASSACRPESAVLWDMVQRGRKGGQRRMIYVEWCAPPPVEVCAAGAGCLHERDRAGCGCDKPEVVQLAHTAVARGRIQLQTIMDLRGSMPPDEFGREVMGWHDVVDEGVGLLVSEVNWAETMDPASQITGAVSFGLDVSPLSTWAAVGVAGKRADGMMHLELTSNESVVDHRPGVDWVVPRLAELCKRHRGTVFISSDSSAKSLIPDLEKAGVTVEVVPSGDVAAAFGHMKVLGDQQEFRHLGQTDLTDAVRGAAIADVGDGTFKLTRRKSAVDITPAYAVVLALHGANHAVDYDVLDSIY